MNSPIAAYPVFWPGDLPFFASERETWTKEQTEAWAAWLKRAIEPRTDHLLKFFEVAPGLARKERFTAAAAAAVELCNADPDAVSAARSPSEIIVRGHTMPLAPRALPSGFTLAIGIDLGLLMGRSLLETYPELLKWEIVWKPKNDISFRNPVLKWGTKMRFDPYHHGMIIAYELASHDLIQERAATTYDNQDQMIRDCV